MFPLRRHGIARRLPSALPPGRLLGPRRPRPHDPVVWLSRGPVPDLAGWWRRLNADRLASGFHSLLLEYEDDSLEPAPVATPVPDPSPLPLRTADVTGTGDLAGADAAAGAADVTGADGVPRRGAAPGPDTGPAPGPDARAWELAQRLCREGRARSLALVEVGRSADLPAAVGWRGPANHVDAAGLSAVLRSWEDRFGIRVVGFEHSTLHVSVASPPTSYTRAQALGREHYALCPDVFHEYRRRTGTRTPRSSCTSGTGGSGGTSPAYGPSPDASDLRERSQ
ncbi:DUF4253 domain-containing protein [Streptomyces wuyuanensis]|uniref:DUF4253 domain-containing protein n=1 Tax=Streptomyces wuyuanensis TaxID=1196353 RepID=UPI00342DB851